MVEEAAIIVGGGKLGALQQRPWGSSDAWRWRRRRRSSSPAEPHLKPLWRLWPSSTLSLSLCSHYAHLQQKDPKPLINGKTAFCLRPLSLSLSLYSWHETKALKEVCNLFVCMSPKISFLLPLAFWPTTDTRLLWESEMREKVRHDRHTQRGDKAYLLVFILVGRLWGGLKVNEVGPSISVWLHLSLSEIGCSVARAHPTCATFF